MDENPYKSPASGQNGKDRLMPWDWLTVFAGPTLIISLIVRILADPASSVHRQAGILHDVAGLVLLAWCALHFGPKLAARVWKRS